MSSVYELIKLQGHNSKDSFIELSSIQYKELLQELYSKDSFLNTRYASMELVPKIYKLFGVHLFIKDKA